MPKHDHLLSPVDGETFSRQSDHSSSKTLSLDLMSNTSSARSCRVFEVTLSRTHTRACNDRTMRAKRQEAMKESALLGGEAESVVRRGRGTELLRVCIKHGRECTGESDLISLQRLTKAQPSIMHTQRPPQSDSQMLLALRYGPSKRINVKAL